VPVDGFSGGRVDAAGVEVAYVEAGSGEPVVVVGPGLEPLCQRLARGRRVIAVEPPDGPARERAGVLGAAAAALGLERYALVGCSGGAPVALWLALGGPVSALVLLAPETDVELEPAMTGCEVPTLVLVGDRDEPARGRVYKAVLPRCVFGIVYRAGPGLVADRPDAVAEWVGDFLDRGLAFAVTTRSALLHQ
jgi:pimeloyl-ACP methyl ester carboxylesterase